MIDPITTLCGSGKVSCRCGAEAASPEHALLRFWLFGKVWGVLVWTCPKCRGRWG